MNDERPASIFAAGMWMLMLSLLLCWLPGLGGLIAGFVGGRMAGSVGNALLAALVPSVILGVLLFLFATLLVGMPVIGLVAGLGGFVLAVTQAGTLLLGALLGALFK